MESIGLSRKQALNNRGVSQSVIYSDDGKWIVQGDYRGKVNFYDSIECKLKDTIQLERGEVYKCWCYALAFQKGTNLLAASCGRRIALIDF